MARSKIPLVIAAVAILIAVGTAAYFMGFLPFSPRAAAAQAQATPTVPTEGPGPQYALKDMVINLADRGAYRYLKISITLEFSWGGEEFRKASAEERKTKQAEYDAKLAPWLSNINDAVISIVSARTVADLSTADGKEKLKTDIKGALNKMLGGDQVTDVLFTQFVMQ